MTIAKTPAEIRQYRDALRRVLSLPSCDVSPGDDMMSAVEKHLTWVLDGDVEVDLVVEEVLARVL